MLLGPGVSAGMEGEVWISSRMGSSISMSSEMLTQEEVPSGLAESSGLRGSCVAKARDPGLFGVELPDARPEVSRTARGRNFLTSVVMLIWPSTLRGRALVGHATGVGLKPPLGDRALDSCPFLANCERSTCRKVGSPSRIVMPLDSDSGRDIITGT